MNVMSNQWSSPKLAEEYAKKATKPEINWYEYGINLPDFLALIPKDAQAVLDLGSGPGDVTESLRSKFHTVEGCDSSEAMLALASQNFPSTTFFKWDGLQPLPDKAGFYDCVVSKLTVHFVEDLDAFATNLLPILKPKGSFVFSVPHPMRSFREIGDESYWQQVNYEEEIGSYGITATFIHRSIQDYFRPFGERGYVLTGLSEPAISPEVVHKHNVDPAYASVPRRLNWRFQKP